jgi:hypothetical protein
MAQIQIRHARAAQAPKFTRKLIGNDAWTVCGRVGAHPQQHRLRDREGVMQQLMHNLKHMDRPVPVYMLTPKQAADFLRKDKVLLSTACKHSMIF